MTLHISEGTFLCSVNRWIYDPSLKRGFTLYGIVSIETLLQIIHIIPQNCRARGM